MKSAIFRIKQFQQNNKDAQTKPFFLFQNKNAFFIMITMDHNNMLFCDSGKEDVSVVIQKSNKCHYFYYLEYYCPLCFTVK